MITVCEDCGIPFTGTDRVDMIDGEFPRKYRHVECPVDDDLGTVRWFGESWGAPINDPRSHVTTPVNERCIECLLLIKSDDQGLMIPSREQYVAFHKRCFFDTIGVPT